MRIFLPLLQTVFNHLRGKKCNNNYAQNNTKTIKIEKYVHRTPVVAQIGACPKQSATRGPKTSKAMAC